jgi:hypothetical protein
MQIIAFLITHVSFHSSVISSSYAHIFCLAICPQNPQTSFRNTDQISCSFFPPFLLYLSLLSLVISFLITFRLTCAFTNNLSSQFSELRRPCTSKQQLTNHNCFFLGVFHELLGRPWPLPPQIREITPLPVVSTSTTTKGSWITTSATNLTIEI